MVSSSIISDHFPEPAPNGFIPLPARVILVESILEMETSDVTRDKLRQIGIIRGPRAVMKWLQDTRNWLGLTGSYPRANVPSYRESIERWVSEHGRPSPGQILAGWSPADGLASRR